MGRLWAVHEQEPRMQSLEPGWELAALPMRLLFLLPTCPLPGALPRARSTQLPQAQGQHGLPTHP